MNQLKPKLNELRAPPVLSSWLMEREERRQEKESNLEGLVRLNVLVSFLTLGLVGGFEAVRIAIELIPYL